MAEDPEHPDHGSLPPVDSPRPDDATRADASDAPSSTGGSAARGSHLDRRTIAITVCIALVAALLAGLIASLVIDDDKPTGGMELQESKAVNSKRVMAQPLQTRDGGETSLGDFFDGRPMLVNLWASNCESCVTEMPLLEAARAANPDIDFVGVATQDDPAQAAKLAKQTKITYPWALDPTGELYYEARGTAMPTTILIDADGKVVASETVAFHSLAEVQSFLDQAG
jgi:thiol-disulfide isomerase/thioredoxin